MAISGFVGTYSLRLDDKGRVTLPAKYRDRWLRGVVLSQGRDHTLFVHTLEEFDSFAAAAMNADINDSDQVAYQRLLLARSEDQVSDAQGRITVSAKVRAYADIARDVVLTGAGRRMDLWNPDAWARYEAAQEELYAAPPRGLFTPA